MRRESLAGVTTVKPLESRLTENSVRPSSASKGAGGRATDEAAPDDASLRRLTKRRTNDEGRGRRYDESEAERDSDIDRPRAKVGSSTVLFPARRTWVRSVSRVAIESTV